MKSSFFNLLLLSAVMIVVTACNRVEPNCEGVLRKNYGQNGINDYQVITGTAGILWFGQNLYQVPMWQQSADMDPFDINSSDNGVYTIDPSYTYEAMPGRGPWIITQFANNVDVEWDETDQLVKFMDNVESQVLNRLILDRYRSVSRGYSNDSLMANVQKFENQVEDSLEVDFRNNNFILKKLTSGFMLPESTQKAIVERNNTKIKVEQTKNEREIYMQNLENAKIEQQTNEIKSQGLTREILAERYIDAIRWSQNRIIITDGKTPSPIMIQP